MRCKVSGCLGLSHAAWLGVGRRQDSGLKTELAASDRGGQRGTF